MVLYHMSLRGSAVDSWTIAWLRHASFENKFSKKLSYCIMHRLLAVAIFYSNSPCGYHCPRWPITRASAHVVRSVAACCRSSEQERFWRMNVNMWTGRSLVVSSHYNVEIAVEIIFLATGPACPLSRCIWSSTKIPYAAFCFM